MRAFRLLEGVFGSTRLGELANLDIEIFGVVYIKEFFSLFCFNDIYIDKFYMYEREAGRKLVQKNKEGR